MILDCSYVYEGVLVMCSILKFRNCMGRNFDYEVSLNEKPFKYDNPNGYDMIGMVTGLVKDYPLFYDAMNVGSTISCPSACSKSSLYIWKFSVHKLLKPSLKNFEHILTRM